MKQQIQFQIRIGCLFWIALLGILRSPLSAASAYQENVPDARRARPTEFQKPVLIEFHGEITMELTRYFNNRLERAKQQGADLLIIEIDSPGGLKIESLQMARALRDCKWAYTVALIDNEAISGGALVSLGCDEVLINPNAKFGDIGEIGFDAESFTWRLIEPKIESYLSRDARDLAESKGRSADLAEAMVDKDVLVYRKVNDDGSFEFKPVRTNEENKPGEPWQLIPESGPERFLTLSGQRAKELGIAQHFAENREQLAAELGVDPQQLRVFKHSSTDSLVHFFNNPFITGLLVLIGLIALYLELNAPGMGAGGLIAGLCATLFFWSRFLGGTAGWLEVLLFAAGVAFLLMEIFVIPGFGVSGLTGIILLFASILLASQNFAFPQTADQWNQSLTTTLMVLSSGCVFLVVAAIISRQLGSIPILNRMVLAPQTNVGSGNIQAKDGLGKPVPRPHPTVSVGDWGHAESLLRPAGRAKFGGCSVDVISDGSFVDAGLQVRIIRINGNVITVAMIEDNGDDSKTT